MSSELRQLSLQVLISKIKVTHICTCEANTHTTIVWKDIANDY